jgi:CRP/FNR family cyclic AMP-dependent transcriptional regulator
MAESKLWYFEQFDIFDELNEEQLEQLGALAHLHQCYRKEIIYFEDTHSDTIYLCKEGRVKITKVDPSGKETTLYIVQPGQIFGELALVDEDRRTHRAEALDSEVLICSFLRASLQEFLAQCPQLTRKVYKSIGERMHKVEQKLADMVFKGSEERIIRFLIEIGSENMKPGVDEAYIRPFFTHEELAYLTATSRQTVTSLLNKLKDQELLSYHYKKMYIKDFSRLKGLVDSE